MPSKPESSYPVIAVDGTAASGKSTFSNALARQLGFTYVNTGAMYRGVTWFLQRHGIDLEDAHAVATAVQEAGVETRIEGGNLVFRVGGIDPLPHVRNGEVNHGVSIVAQVTAVRKLLVSEQQHLAAHGPLVMEGRDIGTVVFPKTAFKFYLDASPGVRAQRRELQGETDAILKRDALDQTRVISPLLCAPDARRLDSGVASVNELVGTAFRHLDEQGLEIVLPLWEGVAPLSQGTMPMDIPTLSVFLPQPSSTPSSAIVICPGGGYAELSFDHEGRNVARWLKDRGVAAFVLRYRLPALGYRHPAPMLDVQRAIRLVRSHAKDWNIDPVRIGAMGFSAGGHLASTASTHFDQGNASSTDAIDQMGCRPDFSVLVYGVVSMQEGVTHEGSKANLLGPNPDPALVEDLSNERQVSPQTPPTVLVHSIDDQAVPIENSRLMHAALENAGVASVLHEYSTGGHGYGYGQMPDTSPPGWLDRVYGWLRDLNYVP